jgi:glutamate synthase (NADPH/NADH) small chain
LQPENGQSRGYGITLFEANEKIGGMLRYGIPEFRLPKSILDKLHKKLVDMDISLLNAIQ